MEIFTESDIGRNKRKVYNEMIGKFLEISTAHISEKSAKILEKDCPPFIRQYESGFFITIPSEDIIDDVALPDEVINIIKYAWKNDIQMIILDCDAEIVEDIPVYEWQ